MVSYCPECETPGKSLRLDRQGRWHWQCPSCEAAWRDGDKQLDSIKRPPIIAAWRYHDGVQWCYVRLQSDIPAPWRNEATCVRVKVLCATPNRLHKVEVVA